AHLVFINQTFTLYQSPYNQALIFPTQLRRYMQKLNTVPTSLTKRHTEFTESLVAQHLEKSAQERIPEYEYDQLRKGVVCAVCTGIMSSVQMAKLSCESCRQKERTEAAVMRSVTEFHLLFPD